MYLYFSEYFFLGLDILIEHLTAKSDSIIAMSADVISDIASSRRVRKKIRTKGGLDILVRFLSYLPG